MKRFLNWLHETLGTKPVSAPSRLRFRPQLEQLDERVLLSLSSAISIQHSYWNFKTQQFNSWTERDWYTAESSTPGGLYAGDLIEYQGTTRKDLGGRSFGYLQDLSASIDPHTGAAEVFALYTTPNSASVVLFDSSGNAHSLALPQANGSYPEDLSATRDGHVYLLYTSFQASYLLYADSNGNSANLGTPNGGATPLGPHPNFVAASQWSGGNEVFVIGWDGSIYLNGGTPGQWTLVDSSANFVALSATPDNTVFAITSDGRLFQETEHIGRFGQIFYDYWAAQDISGGRHYRAISADTDASGRDEVYAIEQTTNTAYLYDQGIWTYQDAIVYDLAAAGGGYFYDVNYYVKDESGEHVGWLFQPNGNPYWTYLGSDLVGATD